ncbi:hypothetical protein MNBD_GAMMA21-1550 [hydrothermal vent metagenome]|uniref:DUF4440 domain-containing protein n=1 Tax=hydrothermal vent metagenome TaxID=652676 RepID=A0A3B1AC03_9ZZZZ
MSAVNEHMIAEQTIHAWCIDLSRSIQQQDIDKHMQLVSQRVQVYGMPTKDTINFRQWKSRRKNEFINDTLLAINFKEVRLISSTPKRLRFNTQETMLGKDGKMVLLDKNITLELEEDETWRVIEEKVNSWRVKKLDLASF